MEQKQGLKILWLDDLRDPNKYFSKKSDTGAFIRNSNYYKNIFSQYNPIFVWVKNFEEFVDYIKNNGLPDMVSFDHDLGVNMKKGADCAKWLKIYCEQTGQKTPKIYAHSANPNGRREINTLFNLQENKVVKVSKDKLINIIKESILDYIHGGRI